MANNYKKYIDLIKEHKILSIIIAIVAIFVLYSFLPISLPGSGPNLSQDYSGERSASSYGASLSNELSIQDSIALNKASELLIKKGSAYIKSQDSEGDYSKIKTQSETLEGWVESINKNEGIGEKTINFDLKIPSEKFDSFIEWLSANFDIKDSSISLYKADIQKQQDEIDIILNAIDIYDRLLKKAENLTVSAESINAISQITDKKLDMLRLLKSYGYQVESIKDESKYSNINIVLTQDKDISLIPEDIGKTFMLKVRASIESITNALMDLLTVPFVIIVSIFTWIIYAVIALIPIFIGYRILKRLYNFISVKIK